jgi:hypothetical protein
VLVDQRIRIVDDAERRFAAIHERQRRTHAVGAHQAIRDVAPDPEGGQRFAGITAGGHRIGIAGRQAAFAERGGQSKTGLDLQFDLAVGWRNQHQSIADHIVPGVGLNQVVILQIVHPLQVGGKEHIRGRAIFDLPGQRGTRREREPDWNQRRLGEAVAQLLQHIGQ